MSGVRIIGALLAAHAPLTNVVPVARIKGGALPGSIVLPAIVLTTISAVDLHMVTQGSSRRVTERVQVTIAAPDYETQKAVIVLIRKACSYQRGDIAGATAVSVLTDTLGPDFMDESASIYLQSQDFKVSFNEAT